MVEGKGIRREGKAETYRSEKIYMFGRVRELELAGSSVEVRQLAVERVCAALEGHGRVSSRRQAGRRAGQEICIFEHNWSSCVWDGLEERTSVVPATMGANEGGPVGALEMGRKRPPGCPGW